MRIPSQVEGECGDTSNYMFADSVEDARDNTQEIQHRLYTYEGKMWHVPKNIAFPANAKILTGWQL